MSRHSLDLLVGPGEVHLDQPVVDFILLADAIKNVLARRCILLPIGELDAIAHREEALAARVALNWRSGWPQPGLKSQQWFWANHADEKTDYHH